MIFYHASNIEGLEELHANSRSHGEEGKRVLYLTDNRAYSLFYLRDKKINFVTCGVREDGLVHYFERFPNQLQVIYEGQTGYLYQCNSNDKIKETKTKGVWIIEENTRIDDAEYVTDAYREILKAEAEGNVIIHRFADIPEEESKRMANHIKEHLEEEPQERKEFYIKYFSSIWD